MEYLGFLGQAITVQVNITVFPCIQRSNIEIVFLLSNQRMVLPYTHTSNLNIIRRLHTSFTNIGLLLINLIINLSTELGILIEIR